MSVAVPSQTCLQRRTASSAMSSSVVAVTMRPARSQRSIQGSIVSVRQCIADRPRPGGSRGNVCAAALAQETAPSTSGRADDVREFAIAMAKIADDTKAEELSVLHVEPLVSWCSYMVVCTVMSKPQLLAVLGRMEDAAVQDWARAKQNSAGSSQWEVLDFGDVVVHVFTAEQREHYDLDGFYAAAEEVPLPFLDDWRSDSSSSSSRGREKDVSSSSSSNVGGSSSSGPVWSKNL